MSTKYINNQRVCINGDRGKKERRDLVFGGLGNDYIVLKFNKSLHTRPLGALSLQVVQCSESYDHHQQMSTQVIKCDYLHTYGLYSDYSKYYSISCMPHLSASTPSSLSTEVHIVHTVISNRSTPSIHLIESEYSNPNTL